MFKIFNDDVVVDTSKITALYINEYLDCIKDVRYWQIIINCDNQRNLVVADKFIDKDSAKNYLALKIFELRYGHSPIDDDDKNCLAQIVAELNADT